MHLPHPGPVHFHESSGGLQLCMLLAIDMRDTPRAVRTSFWPFVGVLTDVTPVLRMLQVWPKDALEAVAYKFLKEMDLDDPTRVKLVALCQSVHRKVCVAEPTLPYVCNNTHHANRACLVLFALPASHACALHVVLTP